MTREQIRSRRHQSGTEAAPKAASKKKKAAPVGAPKAKAPAPLPPVEEETDEDQV